LADFIAFANKDASELTLENKLVAYFNDASQQKLEDGNDRYRAASKQASPRNTNGNDHRVDRNRGHCRIRKLLHK
jgi:hypothetical protein